MGLEERLPPIFEARDTHPFKSFWGNVWFPTVREKLGFDDGVYEWLEKKGVVIAMPEPATGYEKREQIFKELLGGLITATEQVRQVMVLVDTKILLEYAMEGHTIPAARCVTGMPPDARLVRTDCRRRPWTFALIFEHESFDMVRVGSPIPIFELEFEEI